MKRVIVRYKGKEDTAPVAGTSGRHQWDTHFTIIPSDKRGHIDKALPPILARLQIMAHQYHAIRSHSSQSIQSTQAIQSTHPATRQRIVFTH